MKWMLLLVIGLSFLILEARAVINNCQLQAISLLQEPSEIFVFNNYPSMHEFIDCESETLGLEVVIHEAVHLEDIGIPHGAAKEDIERWFKEERKFPFSLYTTDGKNHGEMNLTNAPKPYLLINLFLKSHYADVLADDSHTIHSLLDMYINDQEALASNSFSQGLVTELNAYAHGLRIEHRIKGNDASFLNGRYGLLGFLFFFKAYFYQLKLSYPSIWKDFVDSADTKQIKVLFEQSAHVLQATNHCKKMDSFERRDLFPLISNKAHLEPLREILQNDDLLKIILCQ